MTQAATSTQISDNVNQGYIAGGNLYLGDVTVAQETLFFEPDLEDVTPPAWTTTPKAEELAGCLAVDRLIVLAGQGLDDKTMVARHIAWLLREKLPGEVTVREWYRSSDPQKIETAFDPSAMTILLLTQVLPHNLGHRLNELKRLVQSRLHYAIVTTEGTQKDWGIRKGTAEAGLWHELSWETYYGRPFLADTLLGELTEREGRLPEWLPRPPLGRTSFLTDDITIEETAAHLKQPDRIRRFAAWLESEEASPRLLRAQLEQLGGDREAIFQWYRQLDPVGQLFGLSLALFDGLSDDQIFAAVEYLIAEAWRRTDPNLPQFDYRDLVGVSAYFHLSEAGEDGSRIETSSRQKREAILRAAWDLQRRRLLSVVPALTRLVKQFSPTDFRPSNPGAADAKEARKSRRWGLKKGNSPKSQEVSEEDRRFSDGPDRELFSSQRRTEQLQRSVIESLSQIGLLSFEAIEASFLELAADSSAGVQTIVAKALAAWRGEGQHDKLFRVLEAWWAAGNRTTLPKALERRIVKNSDPLASIRATVALAVGYALQYDPPNQLRPEAVALLKLIAVDRHPVVRQRVMEVALPLAAAAHLQQLEDFFLERIGQDQGQMSAIAYGVSMAFSRFPHETFAILQAWQKQVAFEPTEEQTISWWITGRERLLGAILLSYGYIRDPTNELLPPQKIVAELQYVLGTETHPFVRAQAIMAAGLQGSDNFEIVAPVLMKLISEVTLSDRQNVVSVFVRAYLNQRLELAGGDGEIEVGGKTYQVWMRSKRPLTPIEASLYRWLRDRKKPVARQVAAQTFAAFAATDLEQRERSLGVEEEWTPAAPAPRRILGLAPRPRRLRLMSPFGYLTVVLGAPLKRHLLWPVMAEAFAIERLQAGSASRAAKVPWTRLVPMNLPFVWTVFNRWQANEDKEVHRLARSAKTSYTLFLWRWNLALALVFCLALAWDWKEWKEATRTLPDEQVIALQQRHSAPLRLIRNVDLAGMREAAAERAAARAAIQEAERQLAAITQEVGDKAAALGLTPVEHLRWAAILMNARLTDVDFWDLLRTLDALRREIQALRDAAKAGQPGQPGAASSRTSGGKSGGAGAAPPRVRLAPQRRRPAAGVGTEDVERRLREGLGQIPDLSGLQLPELPAGLPVELPLDLPAGLPNGLPGLPSPQKGLGLPDPSPKSVLPSPSSSKIEVEIHATQEPEAPAQEEPTKASAWQKFKNKFKNDDKKPPTGGDDGHR